MKKLIIMLLASIPVLGFAQHVQFRGGITGGWKAPYGAGLDLSLLIYKTIDISCGMGVKMGPYDAEQGLAGLGIRLYPLRDPYFDPMIGVYLVESSGQDVMTVERHYLIRSPEVAQFSVKPNKAIQINGGFRSRIENSIYFNVGVGYSFPFENEEVEYLNGSTLDELRRRANTASRIGGVAINLGISFSFSGGD